MFSRRTPRQPKARLNRSPLREPRALIPVRCQQLFDICVTEPGALPETPTEVANLLARDYAVKATHPKKLENELRHLFYSRSS